MSYPASPAMNDDLWEEMFASEARAEDVLAEAYTLEDLEAETRAERLASSTGMGATADAAQA